MTIQRMLELLEIEHECMLRGTHDDCDRNCADCDLVQDDDELHEMYTDVISLLKEQEPVKPDSFMDGCVQRFTCKKCGKHLLYTEWGRDDYCSKCGQAVKWE